MEANKLGIDLERQTCKLIVSLTTKDTKYGIEGKKAAPVRLFESTHQSPISCNSIIKFVVVNLMLRSDTDKRCN